VPPRDHAVTLHALVVHLGKPIHVGFPFASVVSVIICSSFGHDSQNEHNKTHGLSQSLPCNYIHDLHHYCQ
jgi:hypothetical protein